MTHNEQGVNISLATQKIYWQKQIYGILSALDIPLDHPRPATRSFIKKNEVIEFDDKFYLELKRFCSQENITLFTMLLAAFKVLLFRYTGQEEIIVGSISCDSTWIDETEKQTKFVNPIVLRTSLAHNPTLKEVLGRVTQTVENATKNRDYPFDKVIENIATGHTLDQPPVFQTMLVLGNVPFCISKTPISEGDLVSVEEHIIKCDLTILASEEKETLKIRCNYDAELFEMATIRRLLGHLQTVLQGIITTGAEQQLSKLPLLTNVEQQLLIMEWNKTASDYPKDKCIHELFETQAEQIPDNIALIYPGDFSNSAASDGREQLTYQELNQRSNQLAHYLQALGVGPEVLVGICMERSFDVVIGLLGILKAGGIYVPLDPTYPKERLAFMLEDTQAPILLTQRHLVKKLPDHKAKVVCIDADWETIALGSQANPMVEVSVDSPAYVVYTSGSTGKPKGVLGLHKGAVNRMHWMWSTYPFETGEVCCQKTSLNFIDSLWEIFGPLLQGVPSVLIPMEKSKDPHELIQILADNQVTRIVLVPSLLRLILDTHNDLSNQLSKLKYWVSSGEALSLELFQRFQERMPKSILLNLYGSSEVTADATWYDTSQGVWQSSVPIGRPIANMQTYILDTHLQPVPIGVPGELYIGGVGLAQGYLNRPELTAERFIRNPFSTNPDTYLYRSGDIIRYLPNGNIEFLGRVDHQVKIRGFRIEPGEIEAVLQQHPTVQEAIVIVKENPASDKRLIAYIVANQGQEIIIDELRDFLKQKLPAYMMPAVYIPLAALPLTPNGKVNRLALPTPTDPQSESKAGYVAPQTDIERTLVAIWQTTLHLERIGTQDNFFDLGGHSLLLAQIHNELQEKLKQDIPVMTLLKYPTISSLAKYLNHQQPEQDPAQQSRSRAAGRRRAIGRRQRLRQNRELS